MYSRRILRAFSCLCSLFVVGRGVAAEKGFALVKDGRAAATIVLSQTASSNAFVAAEELQSYVRKISGAELPIVRDGLNPAGPLILVGTNRFTEAMPGLRIPVGRTPQLREEGLVIHCRGDRLVLAGNDTEPYYGTRYAVAEFLHRIGVRWFMPGEIGEVVPQSPTIVLPETEIRQRPAFVMRNYWEHYRGRMGDEAREWKIRHKMNPRMHEWIGVPGDGSIRNFMPPKTEMKTHPEWFALKRDGARDEHMACMTSTGMIAHFVARVKAEARAGKRFSTFAPDDGMPRCYCGRCQKLANGFDGYGANDRDPLVEASISNEWFYFVDAILNEVNKEFPDHKIVTNGYANRDIPPELPTFNQSSNLVVMFANICACTLHAYDDPRCWQMQRQGQMVRQWARLSDKVWLYNYNYTMLVSKWTITPMVHRVRRNIPLLNEWGVLGFHDQDEADLSLTGLPTRIVRAALEWDTKTDVDALLDDFYSKWFGRAATPMRSYYDALESAFEKTTAHGHEDVVLNTIYTPTLVKKLEVSIQQAEQRAQAALEKRRVSMEREIFNHVLDYVAMETAKRECQFAKAATFADSLTNRHATLGRISPFLAYEPYAVYAPDWEARRMHKLAARTDGAEGSLITVLPESARARPDPHDGGRFERWQDADYDDSKWKSLSTTRGWNDQGLIDERGHEYRGVMWYRLSIDVPPGVGGTRSASPQSNEGSGTHATRPSIWLCAPSVVNEAWVWVNGQYAGHRAHKMPWFRPHAVELDITPFVKPGQRNQITFRVLNNIDVFGASGIYERMFLYARNPDAGKPKE